MSGEQPARPVADTGLDAETLETDQVPSEQLAAEAKEPAHGASATQLFVRDLISGNAAITVLALLISLIVGAILIAATSSTVQSTAGYFLARPGDLLSAIWQSVSGAYAALFQGGIYDFTQTSFAAGIAPIFNSLGVATPLIAAGLGIAIGFRAGMFNIGGQGQILIGGLFGGYVGFAWPLPFGIHLIVAVLAAIVGGALWAGIVGFLKARTGANEVIVTIMLNYVALYLLAYLLYTPLIQAKGSINPISPPELPTAVFFKLLGSQYSLNIGFVLVILATIFCAWLLNRSSLGFKFRAVGENADAARVAGINVNRIFIYVMLVSGGLVGLAGAYQVLAQIPTGFTNGLDAGIGFNAITVALLGRSRPWGVFWAGILFGVFQTGGYTMQASQGIDIDIIQVVQSIVVLFIAAPPLVRAIFRIRVAGAAAPKKSAKKKGVVAQ